jgi:hypothetical protein
MTPLLLALIAWIAASPFVAVAVCRLLFRGRRAAREAQDLADADEFFAAIRDTTDERTT